MVSHSDLFSRRQFLKRSTEAGLALSVLGASGYGFRALSRPYPNSQLLVSAEWLAARFEDTSTIRILDARGPLKYRYEHIPHAFNIWDTDLNTWDQGIPRMVAGPERLQTLFEAAGLSQEKTIVLYDDEQRWAGRLFWILEYHGFPEVRILNGGLEAWHAHGGPLANSTPTLSKPKGALQLQPLPSKCVTGQWLLDHLSDPTVQILDTRTKREIIERVGRNSKSERSGLIPGAINVSIDATLMQTKQLGANYFKKANELEFLFRQIDPAKTIVTYSETGVRAALAYFVLRLLGYPDLRVYDASWAEWGTDPRFPVAAIGDLDLSERHTSTCW